MPLAPQVPHQGAQLWAAHESEQRTWPAELRTGSTNSSRVSGHSRSNGVLNRCCWCPRSHSAARSLALALFMLSALAAILSCRPLAFSSQGCAASGSVAVHNRHANEMTGAGLRMRVTRWIKQPSCGLRAGWCLLWRAGRFLSTKSLVYADALQTFACSK